MSAIDDGGGIEPKTIPKLAWLTEHLAKYSREAAPGQTPATDGGLIDQVRARGYDPDAEESAWLSDETIWPPDVVSKLTRLVEFCEAQGIAYDFVYEHLDRPTPTSITEVVISLRGE